MLRQLPTIAMWGSFGLLLVVLARSTSDDEPTRTHISSAVESHFTGAPNGVQLAAASTDLRNPAPSAAWYGAERLYVVTMGSGSCPGIPAVVTAIGSHDLVITTVVHDFFPQDNGCTADLRPTTSVIRVPDGLDHTHALHVVIDGTKLRLAPG